MYPGYPIVVAYDWWTRRRYIDLHSCENNVGLRGFVHPEISQVCIRQMRPRDYRVLDRIRLENIDWLKPWDASAPQGYPLTIPTTPQLSWINAQDIRHERGIALIIEVDGEVVGHIQVMNMIRAASQSAMLGYWIAKDYANKGVMTLALAMTIDTCIRELRLHRIEVNIRPDNKRSLRVVEKLGLNCEGLRKGFLHVGDGWHDHLCFAITAEDYPVSGVVSTLIQR